MLRATLAFAFILTAGCNDRESQSKIALLEAENSRLQEEAQRAEAASERFDACIIDAQSAYSDRWDKTCDIQRRNDLNQKKICLNSGESETVCNVIAISASKNYSLSSAVADSYDSDHKNDKRLCMDRLRLGR